VDGIVLFAEEMICGSFMGATTMDLSYGKVGKGGWCMGLSTVDGCDGKVDGGG
jgi:hypothetical protein